MPVNVIYHPESDANFRLQYERIFYEWINTTGNNATSDGSVVFDEACIMNGLHPTTSPADPNPEAHVTVRLSNAALREQRAWHILHWRPGGGSLVLARPDFEAANSRRRQKRKQKKKRQQERRQVGKGKRNGRGGRGNGGGSAAIA